MPRLILEISGPRLGSTSFRRKLTSFGSFVTFGELFHQGQDAHAENLAYLRKAYQQNGHNPGTEDIEIRRLARANPKNAIDRALDVAKAQGVSFAVIKIAPSHLRANELNEIIRQYDCIGIILVRAPIDQYISRQKALELNVWKNVDTTAIRPTISSKAFRSARRRLQNHFRMAVYLLERWQRTKIVISYEDLYNQENDTMEVLRAALAPLQIPLPKGLVPVDDLRRQDAEKDRSKKVANWDTFIAEIEEQRALTELETFDLHSQPIMMRAQMLAETLLPEDALRWLARKLGVSGMPVKQK
jgi:hypothetical protein